MRLIDADKFISFIDMGHLRNPSEKCFSELDVVGMIKSQYTAYDVDKVIEQIQNMHLPLASQTVRILDYVKRGGVGG